MKGILFKEELFRKTLLGDKTATRRRIDIDPNKYELSVSIKFDTSHSVGYGEIYKMCEWISDQLTAFWEEDL